MTARGKPLYIATRTWQVRTNAGQNPAVQAIRFRSIDTLSVEPLRPTRSLLSVPGKGISAVPSMMSLSSSCIWPLLALASYEAVGNASFPNLCPSISSSRSHFR